MNDGNFPPIDSMDDLPRTLRREREARERAQKQTAMSSAPLAYGGPESVTAYDPLSHGHAGGVEAYPAVVTRFNVPFVSLMYFFIKAVLAAIPALILLAAILFGFGIVLKTYFPWIVQTEILIRFPK